MPAADRRGSGRVGRQLIGQQSQPRGRRPNLQHSGRHVPPVGQRVREVRRNRVTNRGERQIPAAVEAAFREGVAIDPGYTPLYSQMAIYLLPRWYGRPGDVERFADQALAMSRETIGHSAYATIAWSVHSFHRFRAFRDFDLSWEKTRQGFEDRLGQGYDSPTVLNRYCVLASAAGDRETAHRLFQRIGPKGMDSVWPRPTFQRCRVWADPDTLRGEQRLVLKGHAEAILTVAWSPDGRVAATGGTRGMVLFHDVDSGQEKAAVMLGRRAIMAIVFAPDGKTLAAGASNGDLYLVDTDSHHVTELSRHPFQLRSLAFSPDGSALAGISWDGAVVLWDPATGERIGAIGLAHEQGAIAVAFAPDSQSLISLGRDGEVKVWEWESGTLQQSMASGSTAAGLGVSADGQLVAVGIWERAKVFRLPDGEPVTEVATPGYFVMSLSFCPQGKRLALGLGATGEGKAEGSILIWDLEQDAEVKRLEGHRATLWQVVFSPDGTQLASAANDRTARLWQAP